MDPLDHKQPMKKTKCVNKWKKNIVKKQINNGLEHVSPESKRINLKKDLPAEESLPTFYYALTVIDIVL